MSKTLIACYCEPDKPSLNWQLHALYLSYRDLDCDRVDFRVTVPPGTERLVDDKIPIRVIERITSQFRHPMLEKYGFDGYPFANHFLAVTEEDNHYDHILLTDVDTLLLPRFSGFTPDTFITGRGGYSNDYNYDRLVRFGKSHGYSRTGRYRQLHSTWYGAAHLVTKCSREVLEVIAKLLQEEDWTASEWPKWWIGVLALYASEIVLSERVDNLSSTGDVLDARPSSEEDERAIHLHMWHTGNWGSHFSKHAYDAGYYDDGTVKLTGLADFTLKLARRGSAFVELNDWKRRMEPQRSRSRRTLPNLAATMRHLARLNAWSRRKDA